MKPHSKPFSHHREQEELKIASLEQKKKVTIQQYRQYDQQIKDEGL